MANDFAVDNNREAALDWGRSTETERAHADAALRYQIFQYLARPAEIERRLRLVLSNADRTVLCVVEPVQHYRMAGAVENDDGHRPVVFMASASAAAITFLAASRLIGEP